MTQPRKYLWIHLLVLLVVISVVIFGFFLFFFNHCTKQKLEQQCTFFVYKWCIYMYFCFLKNSTQKKARYTCVCYYKTNSTERIEDGKISWLESKRRRRPLKTSTKQGLRNSGISYKKEYITGRSLYLSISKKNMVLLSY